MFSIPSAASQSSLSSSHQIYTLCRGQCWSELTALIETLRANQHADNDDEEPPYQDFAGGGGNTALHEIVEDPSTPMSVLSLLVQFSPRMVSISNKYGETSIHLAASFPRQDRMLTLLQLLVPYCYNNNNSDNNNSAVWTTTDRFGRTPLHLLYSRQNEDDLYSEYSQLHGGEDLRDGDTHEMDRIDDDSPIHISSYTTIDPVLTATQLILSCIQSSSDISRVLLIVDSVTQRTPLHEACLHHVSSSTLQLIISSCPMAVAVQDVHGNTPLHLLTERMDLQGFDESELEYHSKEGRHCWAFLFHTFLTLHPDILILKNNSRRTPLAHAIFHFAPWSVLHDFLYLEHNRLKKLQEEESSTVSDNKNNDSTTIASSILWEIDSTGKTPIQLLHSTHTESPHPQQLRDLTAHLVYVMLEYPSREIKIGSDKQNTCPPPWHGLDDPKHPFLIHNCLRLGASCPFDYVYHELIQPASFQVKIYESMKEEYPSSTHPPILELDSWGESPLVLFLQIIPTLMQHWETSKIVKMWKDMLSVSSTAHLCQVPLLTHLFMMETRNSRDYPLWIQLCRSVLQCNPRSLLDDENIPACLYPYMIRILAMKETRPRDFEKQPIIDKDKSLFECMQCLPELFLV